MTPGLELLAASLAAGSPLRVVVSGCAYQCCGRPWQRRDGYEQTYHGRVGHLTEEGFLLVSDGVGTISYIVAVAFDEVQLVEET